MKGTKSHYKNELGLLSAFPALSVGIFNIRARIAGKWEFVNPALAGLKLTAITAERGPWVIVRLLRVSYLGYIPIACKKTRDRVISVEIAELSGYMNNYCCIYR